jgi:carboxyl-terminal processing protease
MRVRKEWWLLMWLAASVQAAEVPATDAPAATEPAAPAAVPAPAAPVPAEKPAPATPAAKSAAPTAAPIGNERLPLDDLRIFVEVFERIRASYVDTVEDRTLFENAIRGMLSSLDPHSAYLDPKDYEELQNATSGEFEGIGLDVTQEEGVIKVVAPIDDTPAAKAGIQAGDYIIKIDGKAVQGLSLADAIELMRGKPGTKLNLTILRKGEEPRDIEVVRARIEISSVKSRMLESGIVSVRISQFQTHTGRDLRRELEKKKADEKNPVRGIVLDLRNNPGGVLEGAIAVSDLFLDGGRIVSTRGRALEGEQQFTASPGEVLPGVPIVVLVNGGTASASEIVAGALQDNQRALIIGTTTFGKGSVQTVLPLTAGKGIKLTTARYYTPSGRSIQAAGIRPDIVVPPAKVELLEGGDIFHEADLQGHLSSESVAEQSAVERKSGEKPLIERDYQLAEAVNLLKAAALLKHTPALLPREPEKSEKTEKKEKAAKPVRKRKST